MTIRKSIINFFHLEGGTQPHIVNVMRYKMLLNYGIFFLTRKFNLIRLPYKPINLMVEVSTKCNLTCPTCERELYKEELGGIPKENVELEKIKKLKPILPYVYSIYMVGGLGEPFLNPDFWDIHRFFKSFNIKTGYFSNASMITKDLVRKTLSEKVNTVTISIDTHDKNKYSAIKKGGDYEKVVNNIKLFSEYKKKLNAKYFSLGLNFIFRRDNYKDILDYLDFAKELEVNYIHCTSLITHLEKDKDLSFFLVDNYEKNKIFKETLKKANRLGIGIRLPKLEIEDGETCGYLWRCLSIFYNGDVCTCPFFRTNRNFYYHTGNAKIIYQKKKVSNTVVGNYLEEDIRHIWNNRKIEWFRKGQLNKACAVSPCDNCYYKYNLH